MTGRDCEVLVEVAVVLQIIFMENKAKGKNIERICEQVKEQSIHTATDHIHICRLTFTFLLSSNLRNCCRWRFCFSSLFFVLLLKNRNGTMKKFLENCNCRPRALSKVVTRLSGTKECAILAFLQ